MVWQIADPFERTIRRVRSELPEESLFVCYLEWVESMYWLKKQQLQKEAELFEWEEVTCEYIRAETEELLQAFVQSIEEEEELRGLDEMYELQEELESR